MGTTNLEAAAASSSCIRGLPQMDTMHIERRRDRRALARDAGLGSVSGVSVVAGTLAAYALTAALLAIAGGIATLILSTIVIGWGTYLKSH